MDVRAGCTRQGKELRPRSGGEAVLGLDVIPIYLLGPLTCLFIGVLFMSFIYLGVTHSLWFHCSIVQRCIHCVCVHALGDVQLFCNPMNCSTLGSFVHGIFQARILDWVAVSSFRRYSRPRDPTLISCIGRGILYHWTTREAPLYTLICHG